MVVPLATARPPGNLELGSGLLGGVSVRRGLPGLRGEGGANIWHFDVLQENS